MRTVAALFVDARGCYVRLPDVEVWPYRPGMAPTLSLVTGGGVRVLTPGDARLYEGPHPVVAHPPCSRWCRLAGLVEARWGHKRGDDGGCFESALASVRRWGGVLEHPAYSDAWEAFGLPRPARTGGWVQGPCGGFSCHIEQGRYGHKAKKATWLYAHGVPLPELRWGATPDSDQVALVSWCGNRTRKGGESRPRMRSKSASATPLEFRDVLLGMARSAT